MTFSRSLINNILILKLINLTLGRRGRLLSVLGDQLHRNPRRTAFVIMPDHFHWLFSLKESNKLSDIMQLVKGRSSRRINQFLSQNGSLWEKGYYEHAVRKEEDLKSIGRYIVANPLRAKLVSNLRDYPLWDAVWI